MLGGAGNVVRRVTPAGDASSLAQQAGCVACRDLHKAVRYRPISEVITSCLE